MIPTRSPDIADVIVTVLMRPSGDRGRRLGTAATCDSARGGLLLLDTGRWEPGNMAPGDIQSRAPHPLHLLRDPPNILPPGIPLFPLSISFYSFAFEHLLYCFPDSTGPITNEYVPPVHHGNPHHIQLQLSTVLPQPTAAAAAGCSRNQNIKTPE